MKYHTSSDGNNLLDICIIPSGGKKEWSYSQYPVSAVLSVGIFNTQSWDWDNDRAETDRNVMVNNENQLPEETMSCLTVR